VFINTNEHLKEDFEAEPEPVKEVKALDPKVLQEKAQKAITRKSAAAYDKEIKKEEETKKTKDA
jgi:hypothetical protein